MQWVEKRDFRKKFGIPSKDAPTARVSESRYLLFIRCAKLRIWISLFTCLS